MGPSTGSTIHAALITAALAVPATSTAGAPGFDCAKASGQVEGLICADDALAALDQRLGGVYNVALENYPADELSSLKAEQRGWIKGRNDCWKADDVGACVTQEYQTRIVELQIKSGQLTAPTAIAYDCGAKDQPPLMAAFYTDTDPAAVVLTSGNDQVMAFIAPSGSGARYAAEGVEFWEHHGEATVNWFGTESNCTVIR